MQLKKCFQSLKSTVIYLESYFCFSRNFRRFGRLISMKFGSLVLIIVELKLDQIIDF